MSKLVQNQYRAVARSENPGGHLILGGDNVPPPLLEIGLTDMPKFEGAMAPPAPPGTTPLLCVVRRLTRPIFV